MKETRIVISCRRLTGDMQHEMTLEQLRRIVTAATLNAYARLKEKEVYAIATVDTSEEMLESFAVHVENVMYYKDLLGWLDELDKWVQEAYAKRREESK